MFPTLQRAKRRQEVECESFLSFLFYAVGLLLPLWSLLITEPPASLAAWEAAGAHGAPRHGAPRRGPLARLEATLEGAMRQLCGRSWLASPEPADEQDAELWAAVAVAGDDVAAAAERRLQRRLRRRMRLQGWERGVVWWMVFVLLWAVTVLVHTRN